MLPEVIDAASLVKFVMPSLKQAFEKSLSSAITAMGEAIELELQAPRESVEECRECQAIAAMGVSVEAQLAALRESVNECREQKLQPKEIADNQSEEATEFRAATSSRTAGTTGQPAKNLKRKMRRIALRIVASGSGANCCVCGLPRTFSSTKFQRSRVCCGVCATS